MRRFILILMIALLPIRGWAADMMAVAMAAQQVSAVRAIQSGVDVRNVPRQLNAEVASRMAAPCPMMAMLANKSVDSAGATEDLPIFKVCTTCQLCMALATERQSAWAFAPVVSFAPPVSHPVEFIGLMVFPVLKPPIT